MVTDFKTFPLRFKTVYKENDGIQYTQRFDNDYGVSIIKQPYSYGYKEGLWELAVLRYTGDKFDLCYSTDITDNVLGHLTDEEVNDIVDKIIALPKAVGGEIINN